MKILFLGDDKHPNAQSWIKAMKEFESIDVVTWSLPFSADKSGKWKRIFGWLGFLLTINRKIRKEKPDILIAYRITSYGFLGGISGFHPLVVANQGAASDIWPLHSALTSIKRYMAQYCLKRADLIHAWGEHMAKSNIGNGASPDKIMILPRGIDVERFFPPAKLNSADKLKLVVTRSLFPEYAHDIIIRAVADVASKGMDISLSIIGEGALKFELQNLVTELGVQDIVTFHGKVSHSQLPDHLRQANVYVSMPITEGISASLFEAMSCGLYPCVTDLPANRYWIKRDISGSLMPINDSASLAEEFWKLWKNQPRFDTAFQINQELIKSKASLRKNIHVFVEAYKDLLHKNKSNKVAEI